jgi:putative PIN family toxin of toxin-antitoxin system
VRIVLDTNVFVSGVFFSGAPYQILKAWRDEELELAVSPEILEEYRRVGQVLGTQHPQVDLEPVLDFLIQRSIIFAAPALAEPVCDDPDDDKFIACALASGSRVIVSGDKHLLRVSGYQEIEVLKPRDFLGEYLE